MVGPRVAGFFYCKFKFICRLRLLSAIHSITSRCCERPALLPLAKEASGWLACRLVTT
nr:MAG TPA_asm: hypothetical protein [Caudoviricetes sp.]